MLPRRFVDAVVQMSDTPRTDAFHDSWDSYNFPMEAIEFARKFERELAQERKENDESAKLLQEALAEIRRLNRFFITSGHD
jgi:hypothetical protein